YGALEARCMPKDLSCVLGRIFATELEEHLIPGVLDHDIGKVRRYAVELREGLEGRQQRNVGAPRLLEEPGNTLHDIGPHLIQQAQEGDRWTLRLRKP